MERSNGSVCPKCLRMSLDVYYEEDSDLRLGAICRTCGLKGYFSEDRLVPMNAL